MPTSQSTYFDNAIYFDSSNPLRGYIGQCTWYCWSKAHIKAQAYPERKLNVSKLPTSGAGHWAADARAHGYTVSTTPISDSIAVWGSGHVAYVESWDGANVCFSEANWYTTPTPDNTIQVPGGAAFTSIKKNVKALTSNVRVVSGGTDGTFKNLPRHSFESRKESFLGYIYLN